MASTLLEIAQDICAELGLPRPMTVVGSTDFQIQQIYALLNREGRELQQNYEWTALQTVYDLHVAQPTLTTGNITINSAVVTGIPSTAGLTAGDYSVTGTGLPVATRLQSVDSATQVTLTQPATVTSAAVPLTFAKDTYPEPDDFGRFINETWWDRTNQWALLGPDSPQRYQQEVSGVVTTGPRRHFRQVGASPKNYRIWPPPGTLDTPINLAYEYISINWARSALGVPQSKFLADDDTSILDSNFFVLGGKWRLWQAKQLDYAPFQQEYIDYVDRAFGQDGGNKTLNMARSAETFLLGPWNVPDGSWPPQ